MMFLKFFILTFLSFTAAVFGCEILPDDGTFVGSYSEQYSGMNSLSAAVWENSATSDMGCDVNYNGITTSGTDVDYYGEEVEWEVTGVTAFHIGAIKGAKESLEVLMAVEGANITMKD